MLLVVIVISFLHRTAAIHSPPTDHSIFLLHTLPASTTCASQDPYLSRHLCPGHSVSQTGKLQGQKRAAASSPPVQLEERKKKGKKGRWGEPKGCGPERLHTSRADIWCGDPARSLPLSSLSPGGVPATGTALPGPDLCASALGTRPRGAHGEGTCLRNHRA